MYFRLLTDDATMSFILAPVKTPSPVECAKVLYLPEYKVETSIGEYGDPAFTSPAGHYDGLFYSPKRRTLSLENNLNVRMLIEKFEKDLEAKGYTLCRSVADEEHVRLRCDMDHVHGEDTCGAIGVMTLALPDRLALDDADERRIKSVYLRLVSIKVTPTHEIFTRLVRLEDTVAELRERLDRCDNVGRKRKAT